MCPPESSALRLAAKLANDDAARMIQLAIEYAHSRRTAASTGLISTATVSDPALKDSHTRRWTSTPNCLPDSLDPNRKVER